MAESVDALVSNTSGATHPGSIPGLGTKSLQKQQSAASFPLAALFLYYSTKIPPSLTKFLETPLYKGFEGRERFFLSLPNLSTISHVTSPYNG